MTLGTLKWSLGTKKKFSKFLSYNMNQIICSSFSGFVLQKLAWTWKIMFFLSKKENVKKVRKITWYFKFSPIFAKQIYKMHYIWCDSYCKTKILRKFFWSHGTPLGSLGSRSQEALHLGFLKLQILVIWGLYDYPALVAFETQAENPKTMTGWCDYKTLARARATTKNPVI